MWLYSAMPLGISITRAITASLVSISATRSPGRCPVNFGAPFTGGIRCAGDGCRPRLAALALAPAARILSHTRMDFSPQQDGALKAVARWLKAGRPQVFRLFGYAGTG